MKVKDLKLGKLYVHADSNLKVRINASGMFGTGKIGISYMHKDNGESVRMEHKIYDDQLEEITIEENTKK